MTTKLKWRLKELPETHEVAHLVKEGIMTKDEAREILFSQETEEDRTKKSLQDEIKFLRELVQKLSNNIRTEIVRQIEYIEKPYRKYDWYDPYKWYCNTSQNSILGVASDMTITDGASNTVNLVSGTNALYYSAKENGDFTAIKTF